MITNTLETVKGEGSKKWVGDTAEDRPESITIRLMADGQEKQVIKVTSEDNWKWSLNS